MLNPSTQKQRMSLWEIDTRYGSQNKTARVQSVFRYYVFIEINMYLLISIMLYVSASKTTNSLSFITLATFLASVTLAKLVVVAFIVATFLAAVVITAVALVFIVVIAL